MTREEAIDWLCRLRANLNNGVIFTPLNKEFTEALNETLEQQLCDDCIRREDALMALTGEWTELTDEVIHRFIKRIKNLPPVNPQEPKTDTLDKIRAEIEEQVLESLSDGGDDWFVAEKVNECLEIIDKYKAEGSDKYEN